MNEEKEVKMAPSKGVTEEIFDSLPYNLGLMILRFCIHGRKASIRRQLQSSHELETEIAPWPFWSPQAVELKAEKDHHSHMGVNLKHQGQIRLLLYNETKITRFETWLRQLNKDSHPNKDKSIVDADHLVIKVEALH